jgi:hypothetical protein
LRLAKKLRCGKGASREEGGSGVRIYIATWVFDGIGGVFRPLSWDGRQSEMGGGDPRDPKIMDDIGPLTIP